MLKRYPAPLARLSKSGETRIAACGRRIIETGLEERLRKELSSGILRKGVDCYL